MIDTAVVVISAGSFAASFVNAAFATGGVYIMLFASISVLPVSAAIPLQSAFAASSLGARLYFFWHHIDWRIVKMFVFGCLFGVYLGLKAFVALPDATLSFLLGLVLLLLIWMPTVNWQLPIKHTFFLTGVVHSYLGALFGVGGVLQPLIIRTSLLKLQITGTLAACLLTLDALKVTGYISFGFNYFDFIPHIVGATIAGFIGTWLGKRVTHHVSEHAFRLIFRVLVSLLAVRLLSQGIVDRWLS